MIEVLGRRNSANVQKVMWALGELGLEYRRQDVGGSFGYPDDYPSPNQVVPALRDGDLAVWESNACVRYLCRTYGDGSLWPADPATLAIADVWMEWQRSDISFSFFPMFQALIRGLPATPEKIEAWADGSGRIFGQLDRQLADNAFVAGEQLTFADIAIGVMMFRYFTLPIDRPPLPHVERWYHALTKRDAYQYHVMIEYGSNPQQWAEIEAATAGVQ